MANRSEKQILEQRANIIEQVKDKWAGVRNDKRSPSEDELAFFDKADVDIIALTAEVDEIRKSTTDVEGRVAKYESLLGEKAPDETRAAPGAPKDKPEVRAVLDKFMRKGIGSLDKNERSVMDNFEKRGTDTLISSTDALGGYTMPDEWASSLYKTMLWYGGAIEAAGIQIKSSKGGDLHLPKGDDTSNVGAIIGQASADAVLDTAYTELVLGVYDYTSKMIKVGWDLIEDSAYDIIGHVQGIAAERVGRILNTHFTTGTGTGQPNGMVTASTLGKTAASATAVTRNEIVDLVHSLDPAHRSSQKVGFMFNDAKLAAIKKLAFGTGDDRPLWQFSIREGEPDRLEGYRYWINSAMPASTTGLKSMLFGDFGAYKIRQVGGYTLARSADRYIDERALVFFVFARFDGDLINTAAIKHLIQA